MDILGGMLFGVAVVLLLFLLFLFLRKDPAAGVSFLSAEVTTEEGEYLVRILPVRTIELPRIVCAPVGREEQGRDGLAEELTRLLRNTVLAREDIPIPFPAFHISLLGGLMERVRAGSHLLPSSREILVFRTMKGAAQKPEEQITLGENLLPPLLGPALWRILVVERAGEFLFGLDRSMAAYEILDGECRKWIEGEDAGIQEAGRGVVRHLLSTLRNESVIETEALRSDLGKVESEQVRILHCINRKAVDIREETDLFNTDRENAILEAVEKYERALSASLCAVQVRLIAAVLGSIAPVDYLNARQRLEECRKILEEESGQITMMFKILETTEAEHFIELSPEEPEGGDSAVFSLHYPSYLMQELLKWYRKHRILERVVEVRSRLQEKFGEAESRINEYLRIIADTVLFTENPLKGELPLLALMDTEGKIREVERITEVRRTESPAGAPSAGRK